MLYMWLPMNGNLEQQGCSNVIADNVNAVIDNNGKIGKCYSFNGTNQYINLQNIDLNGWPELSICCWCYPTADFNDIFLTRGGGAHRFKINANGFVFRDTNNSTQRTVALGQTIPINTWTHITCTYNRGEVYIYCNGIQTNHSTTYYHDNSTLSLDLTEYRIARAQTSSGSTYYSGKLNDFRIYNHALSAAEVREISQGLVLHYKLDNRNYNLLNHTNNFTANEWALTRSTITENGIIRITPTGSAAYGKYKTNLNYTQYNNQTYTLSFDAQELPAENETYTTDYIRVYYGFNIASRPTAVLSSSYDAYTYKNVTLKGEGWQHYSTTFSVSDSVLTSGTTDALVDGSVLVIELGRRASKKPIEAKNIKLEIGSVDTGYYLSLLDYGLTQPVIEDSSGYGHQGIIVENMTATNGSPRYSLCSLSPNQTSYITTSNNIFTLNTEEFTYSCWIKTTTVNQNCIFANRTATDNLGITMFINNNTPKNILFDAGAARQTKANPLELNTWYHLAFTYKKGDKKCIYVNGTLIDSTNSPNSPTANNNTLFFGAMQNGAGGVQGSMSDIRIYMTPLDADAIRQLYKIGAKVDNKQNLHTFELVENNSKIQVTKQGQVKCNELEEDEKTKFYQTDQIIETNEFIEL